MKTFLKSIAAIIVVVLACVMCSKWIPAMNLTEKISVSDEVDYDQDFAKLQQDMVISQAFVPEYDRFRSIAVYIDVTYCERSGSDIDVVIEDRRGTQAYQNSIPRTKLKDCGWQEIVTDLELKAGEIYYLKVSSDDSSDNPPQLALTDAGKMCTQMVYALDVNRNELIPYYLVVIFLAGFLLVRIFKK